MLVFQSRSCTAERRSRCASVEIVWLGATSWEHGIYNIGEIFSTGYWMVRRSQRGECRCLRPRTPWCGVISQLAGSTAPDSGGGGDIVGGCIDAPEPAACVLYASACFAAAAATASSLDQSLAAVSTMAEHEDINAPLRNDRPACSSPPS